MISCADKYPYDSGEIIITGTVRLVGSAMFSSMVITDKDDHDWYIENEDRDKLAKLEQQNVKVRGKPEYEELAVSGEKMGLKRYLRDINILN